VDNLRRVDAVPIDEVTSTLRTLRVVAAPDAHAIFNIADRRHPPTRVLFTLRTLHAAPIHANRRIRVRGRTTRVRLRGRVAAHANPRVRIAKRRAGVGAILGARARGIAVAVTVAIAVTIAITVAITVPIPRTTTIPARAVTLGRELCDAAEAVSPRTWAHALVGAEGALFTKQIEKVGGVRLTGCITVVEPTVVRGDIFAGSRATGEQGAETEGGGDKDELMMGMHVSCLTR
jgi:hypothetical protein